MERVRIVLIKKRLLLEGGAMFQSLATQLLRQEMIEACDYEIYRYGCEVLLYFIVNAMVAFIIGVMFHQVGGTLLFLGCYCTLRQFTGGYHAKNYTACTLTFAGIYTLTLFLISRVSWIESPGVVFALLGVSGFIIYQLAPLEHANKPLTQKEKLQYQRVARFMTLGILGVMIGLWLIFGGVTLGLYPVFAIFWIAALLILGKYFN